MPQKTTTKKSFEENVRSRLEGRNRARMEERLGKTAAEFNAKQRQLLEDRVKERFPETLAKAKVRQKQRRQAAQAKA